VLRLAAWSAFALCCLIFGVATLLVWTADGEVALLTAVQPANMSVWLRSGQR